MRLRRSWRASVTGTTSVLAALTLLGSSSLTSTASAQYGYLWTTGQAARYLVTYPNIDIATCHGRGKAVRAKHRAPRYSRFGCLVVYTNGHTGIVGVAPTSAYHAGVLFL